MNADNFAKKIVAWWQINKRNLPWKNTKDPYHIWLSEIILQQTRVDQGSPYFLRFVQAFPTIATLAAASEDEVLKLWEGLGYYSRARNLHHTARYVVANHNSIFPSEYDTILSLKGIGPYTAAAISSYAFGKKYAVVDGNVTRVIARLTAIHEAVDEPKTIKTIQSYVTAAIQNVSPGDFNQGMMDFGSLICTPHNPKCEDCPVSDHCVGLRDDVIKILPFKNPKPRRKERYFHYFHLEISENITIIVQRMRKDIWFKLFELPMIETDQNVPPDFDVVSRYLMDLGTEISSVDTLINPSFVGVQLLTHQKVNAFFYKLAVSMPTVKIKEPQYLVERKKVSNFAFPKIIRHYFDNIV